MLAYWVILNSFITDVYIEYIQHEMSASPYTSRAIFDSTKTIFMLALLCLYFCYYIFIEVRKIANIQC